MSRRALTFEEYGRLRDKLREKDYRAGIERIAVKADAERILGKSISMSTIGKLCKELGIIYKYSPRGTYPNTEPTHRCPACGSRIKVKIYK